VRKVTMLALPLAAALVAGCGGQDLPEPRGNFADGQTRSAVNPNEDCDTDDLYAGDADCDDAHYATAFSYVGVTTKAQFESKYGFHETEADSSGKKKRKKKKR
jgi:hypothetical protein